MKSYEMLNSKRHTFIVQLFFSFEKRQKNHCYTVYEKQIKRVDEEKRVVTKIESDVIPIYRYE